MELLITLIAIIIFSFISMKVSKKFGLSASIGLLVGGVLLGSGSLEPLIEPNSVIIHSLGEIGFVFLMFLAGLEISWSMLYKERKNAVYIATFAALTPFLLGFIIFIVLGYSLLTALTVGICMSITAEASKASVLEDIKKLRTKLGSLMMGAGMIDDMIGITLFTIVSYIFTQTMVTQEFVMHFAAVAAYFIGINAHRFVGRSHKNLHLMERLSLIFIVPFFFVSMGIYFKSQPIIQSPYLFLIITSVAIVGKMFGTYLTKPLTKLSFKKLSLVGWGMNSRGAVELALAFLALRIGLITTEIYSALIAMAVLTTLLFPLFATRMIKKNPKIMD
jgi:Kef-type K+ transport system membrane component KefB